MFELESFEVSDESSIQSSDYIGLESWYFEIKILTGFILQIQPFSIHKLKSICKWLNLYVILI